jgi:O-antigen/teichoic acid export membrane protein
VVSSTVVNTIFNRLSNREIAVVSTAAATYLGRFGQGIALLINLPIIRSAFDPELFGVWMMLTALMVFLGFADLGIGNSIINRISKCKANSDYVSMQKTLVAGYSVLIVISILICIFWFLWVYLNDNPTSVCGVISKNNQGTVLDALKIYVVIIAVGLPANLIQRIQLGVQQGYWNGVAQFIGAIVATVYVWFIIQNNASLSKLVIATIGVPVVVNLINTCAWFLLNKQNLFNRGLMFEIRELVSLIKDGWVFFVLQIAAAFAFQSDSIVITQILGQKKYAEFALVQRFFLYLNLINSAAISGLWPAFSDAINRNDLKWIQHTLKKSLIGCSVFTLIGAATLGLTLPLILKKWFPNDPVPGAGLILGLAIWVIIDANGNVVGTFLNGANLLRIQLYLAVSMSISAFIGKWYMVQYFGVAGAVFATIFAYSAISIPGQYLIIKTKLKAF